MRRRRSGYRCSTCGKWHDDAPAAWHFDAPASYASASEDERAASRLTADRCELDGGRYFLKALLPVPVVDDDRTFEWGLWVEMDPDDYADAVESWEEPGREDRVPYAVTMDNALPAPHGPALRRPAQLRVRPVGERPIVEIPDAEDPLAVEQSTGIAVSELQRLAEVLMHRDPGHPLAGTRFEMDSDREIIRRACPGCGDEHPEARGYLYRDGEPFAVYKANLFEHGSAREVYIDAILGSWGQVEEEDHVTFGCRFGRIDGVPDPTCSLVRGADAYPDAPIYGRKLDRDDALRHEWVGDFWSVVDYLLLNDPDVAPFAANV